MAAVNSAKFCPSNYSKMSVLPSSSSSSSSTSFLSHSSLSNSIVLFLYAFLHLDRWEPIAPPPQASAVAALPPAPPPTPLGRRRFHRYCHAAPLSRRQHRSPTAPSFASRGDMADVCACDKGGHRCSAPGEEEDASASSIRARVEEGTAVGLILVDGVGRCRRLNSRWGRLMSL